MKTLKTLLLILAVSLMSSCASFQIESRTSTIDVNHYNYDRIHYLYTNNPNYFYNTTYIDQYGIRNYYYQHPYFVRYCSTRNITPYRQPRVYHKQPRSTYVAPVRRESKYTRVNSTPVNRTRVNNNSKIRRQNTRVIRPTTITRRPTTITRRSTQVRHTTPTRRVNSNTGINRTNTRTVKKTRKNQ